MRYIDLLRLALTLPREQIRFLPLYVGSDDGQQRESEITAAA